MKQFALINMRTGELRYFVDRVVSRPDRGARLFDEQTVLEFVSPGYRAEYESDDDGNRGVYRAGDWRSLADDEKRALNLPL